jgi:hypothetical protein
MLLYLSDNIGPNARTEQSHFDDLQKIPTFSLVANDKLNPNDE